MAALSWGLAAGQAAADRVLIVLSSEAVPYTQAEESCTRRLESFGISRSRTTLEAMQKSGIQALLQGDTVAVIALGTPAAVYLHEHLAPELPLLFAMVSQPEQVGLTQGRPCTGISTDVPQSDQFDLIHRALPEPHRVGVLYHSKDQHADDRIHDLRAALPGDCRLLTVSVDEYDSMAEAIIALLKLQPTIIWTEPDASIYNAASIRALLLAGLRQQTPVFGFSSAFVKAGALIGVNIKASAQGEQVAELTRQVLQQPEAETQPRIVAPHYQIAVNLIVAEKLNVRINEDMLKSASIVYRD
ncbi:MAG: hypothetical protein IT445_20495 [Phycisphaeraceae bacterium]|nr:hypothetical protein [Phycisphaeraceae bacterium]